MVIWRFSPIEPTWEEMRARILATPEEKPRLCVTLYPNSISKKFKVSEVGTPLMLTPLIEGGLYYEAAEAARVKEVLQSVVRKSCHCFIGKIH